MGKYGWRDNKLTAYDVVIDNDLTISGDLSFGDAVVDSFVIKGRVSTSTVAGAALSLTASYTYSEAMELRWNVASWTGTGNSFNGLYTRAACTVGNASGGLQGAQIMGVFDVTTGTTGLSDLKAVYAECLVKANTTGNKTIASMNSVEANISIENYGATTLTFTNDVHALKAKVQTGTGIADYTKMCGIAIQGRDDGTSRTFGKALSIEDPEATVCKWTSGISISAECTNAIVFSKIGTGTTGALIQAGTSAANLSAGTTADANYMQFYITSAATTGTTRGIYDRLYLTGGAGGEALRAFTTVSSNAPVDTVNGAHISLNFGASAGNVTGLGTAVRATLHVPNRSLTGTTAAVQAEIFGDDTSSAIGGTTSFLRCVNDGSANGKASVDSNGYFFTTSGLTANTGKMLRAAAPTSLAASLRVLVEGTVYYLPLYSAAA